jgi:hypothetical protein
MFDERVPPDGYEYTGRTPHEIRLVDPVHCPGGHPARLVRRGWSHCPEHGTHYSWACACGQEIWRVEGAFVGVPCAATTTRI